MKSTSATIHIFVSTDATIFASTRILKSHQAHSGLFCAGHFSTDNTIDIPRCFNFRVTGDGNFACLFYAASTSVYGEESQGLILRVLTIIELFKNADYYAKHPCLLDADREGIFLTRKQRI